MYIRGAQNVNRAVDGDIVAFELLPETEWFDQGDDNSSRSTAEQVRPRFTVPLTFA